MRLCVLKMRQEEMDKIRKIHSKVSSLGLCGKSNQKRAHTQKEDDSMVGDGEEEIRMVEKLHIHTIHKSV